MVQALARRERLLAFFVVLFACLHLFLFLSDAYLRHPPLDILMHFLGGIWFGFFFFHFLFDRGRVLTTHPAYEAFVVLGSVAFVCVMWEFHEFAGDLFIRVPNRIMQTGVRDTMSDLLFGMLGGTIAVILRTYLKWQRHSQSPEGRS